MGWDGTTPLMLAVRAGQLHVVEYLIMLAQKQQPNHYFVDPRDVANLSLQCRVFYEKSAYLHDWIKTVFYIVSIGL